MILRAHEMPTWAGVYLVEDTDEGPRMTHVAEVGPIDGRTMIWLVDHPDDPRTTLEIPDDGRRLRVEGYPGDEWAVPEDCAPQDDYEPDPYDADRAAEDYESGLDARMERRGYG